MEPNASPPFQGLRVVELAQWVFVPVAGALLADWGADVIRIERLEGDPYRGLATQGIGTDRGGVNLSMALANRGKRSVALNLQHEAGLAVLHEMLTSADVFLTSLRPGALGRLGLDADTLRARYPSLIYARGHGFGVRGPDANQPGYDSSAFWARGGVGHILTPPERDYPISQRGAMGDRNGAMALAFGIATALLKRTKTGAGSVVDVSLLATAMWTLSSDLLAVLNGGEAAPMGGRGPAVNPLVGNYRTKDGRHIQLMFLQGDRYWPEFCRVVGRDDLIDDPRFADLAARRANAEAFVAELDSIFARHTLAEWKELLAKLDAPWAPVQSVQEVIEDPQVVANGYVGEVRLDEGQALSSAGGSGAARRAGGAVAPRARARRAHRGAAAGTRLRLGWDFKADGAGGHSVTERPVPVPDEASAPFWSAAAEHLLTVARCAQCGQFTMPPDVVCPHCRTSDPRFEFTPVSGRGTVRSWTVVRQALLPGFEDELPFVLVDVELVEQADLRLIGRLLDGPDALDADLHIGHPVVVGFEDLAPGVAVPAFELSR